MPKLLHPDVIETSLRDSSVGHTCHFWSAVSSTQDIARDLAFQGAASGTLVTADFQTAGRGTHGRTWLADSGGSLLLSVLLDVSHIPLVWLTVAASVALVEAIHETCGVQVVLAWPNDVNVEGRKLAGVLTEVPAGCPLAIVGIGLNFTVPREKMPDDAAAPIGLEQLLAIPLNPDALVVALCRRLAFWRQQLLDNELASLRSVWKGLLSTLGRRVVVRVADDDYDGTAIDVADDGALVVAFSDGSQRTFASGRVREVVGSSALSVWAPIPSERR